MASAISLSIDRQSVLRLVSLRAQNLARHPQGHPNADARRLHARPPARQQSKRGHWRRSGSTRSSKCWRSCRRLWTRSVLMISETLEFSRDHRRLSRRRQIVIIGHWRGRFSAANAAGMSRRGQGVTRLNSTMTRTWRNEAMTLLPTRIKTTRAVLLSNTC